MKNHTSPRRGVLRPKQVRGANSAVVLQMLRRSSQLSRAELARSSGLSDGTVSRIIAGLLEQKLVREEGAENSTGGRPATRLELSDGPKAIGVEIQNWEIRFAVSTMSGALTERDTVRTPSTPVQTVSLIAEYVDQILARHGGNQVHGIGICARGIINSRTGVVEMGNAPGWIHVPLREMLEAKVRLPIYVENDVRAAASAEYNYTAAGQHAPHCLLYVRVDEGVGMSLILNGTLYAGHSMGAGEFGQMVIADDGGALRHDRPGCLENLVSNTAVCQRYAAALGRRAAAASDSGARVRKICQRAMAGDPVAIGVMRETARYLGLGIANVVWGLDPEVVVVSSALNMAWPTLHEAIRGQFPDPAAWPRFRLLSVQRSALDEQGVLIGAATMGFAPLFQPE